MVVHITNVINAGKAVLLMASPAVVSIAGIAIITRPLRRRIVAGIRALH